jgi:hypothetical protein
MAILVPLLLIVVAYFDLLKSFSIDTNISKLEELRGINSIIGLNFYVFELFFNPNYGRYGRRFLSEKSQRVEKSKIFNTKKIQQCKDSGEAYSAAYLIHKDHLLNQFTNYNLTWVNCEMG